MKGASTVLASSIKLSHSSEHVVNMGARQCVCVCVVHFSRVYSLGISSINCLVKSSISIVLIVRRTLQLCVVHFVLWDSQNKQHTEAAAAAAAATSAKKTKCDFKQIIPGCSEHGTINLVGVQSKHDIRQRLSRFMAIDYTQASFDHSPPSSTSIFCIIVINYRRSKQANQHGTTLGFRLVDTNTHTHREFDCWICLGSLAKHTAIVSNDDR